MWRTNVRASKKQCNNFFLFQRCCFRASSGWVGFVRHFLPALLKKKERLFAKVVRIIAIFENRRRITRTVQYVLCSSKKKHGKHAIMFSVFPQIKVQEKKYKNFSATKGKQCSSIWLRFFPFHCKISTCSNCLPTCIKINSKQMN